MAHEHPSFFELDQLALSGGEARLASLNGCVQCLAYIEGQQRTLPVPSWVHQLDKPKWPRWLQRRWLAFFMSGALATTAALLITVRRNHGVEPEVAKGLPSVSLLIKHGEQVRRWNGKESVEPGDSLMLEAISSGCREISVESRSGTSPALLYRGALRGERTLLPQSYRVDAEPGPERLRVLFGGGCESWSVDLEIPKVSP